MKLTEMHWQLIIDGKVFKTIPDSIFRKQYKRLRNLKGITFMPITEKKVPTFIKINTRTPEINKEHEHSNTTTFEQLINNNKVHQQSKKLERK